jgi:hypothetical protein
MPEGFVKRAKPRRMAGAPAPEDDWAPDEYIKGFESRKNALGHKEFRALSEDAWRRVGGREEVMAMEFPEQIFYSDKEASEDPSTQRHEQMHIAQDRGPIPTGRRDRPGSLLVPGAKTLADRTRQYPPSPSISAALKSPTENVNTPYELPAYEFEAHHQPKSGDTPENLQFYLNELRWLNPGKDAERGLATFESSVDPELMRSHLKSKPLAPMRPDPGMKTDDRKEWWENLWSRLMLAR